MTEEVQTEEVVIGKGTLVGDRWYDRGETAEFPQEIARNLGARGALVKDANDSKAAKAEFAKIAKTREKKDSKAEAEKKKKAKETATSDKRETATE